MPVSFKNLRIGEEYDRPYLAEHWGYKGFQAISRGVVTPSDTKIIILFVTKHKQEMLTQYNDFIDGDYLYWEGEEKHTSDNRIVNSNDTNSTIHLFYREVHHSPFIYHGEIFLDTHEILTDAPSRFKFRIINRHHEQDIIDDIETHQQELKNLEGTERTSIIKSRIGQGFFRDGVIKLWKSCAVTDLKNHSLLRASHIKPWRDCTNQERLDPMNGLLLQPTLDYLFDLGLIAFSDDKKIIISNQLTEEDIKHLQLSRNFALRKIPNAVLPYLDYHRRHVFKND